MKHPESKHDDLIDELIKDDRYKITAEGKIYTKLTENGQGLTDEWREIGYKKNDGYVRIRYKDEFLFVQRVIYKKFKGDLRSDMTINHINLNHSDNRPENLEMVTQEENNQKKHKKYKKAFLARVAAKLRLST